MTDDILLSPRRRTPRARRLGALLLALLVSSTYGCANMKINDFSKLEPEFRLETYFAGKTRAYGLFEDRFGRVQRQFVVDITGTWDGDVLTLDEDFRYSDGEVEKRIWQVRRTGPNSYAGSAENVVGEARGERAGNAFNWQYDFNLKVGDGRWQVHFDDWMFLQPDGVMLNKATVSRWGIKLGTVFLSFRRLTPPDGGESS